MLSPLRQAGALFHGRRTSSSIQFDRHAACDKACGFISAAAQKDTSIAAFSETWLPFLLDVSIHGHQDIPSAKIL
jgi:hypothetical protein